MVRAKYQTKRAMCIALFNRYLHQNSWCPANYDVDYGHGWFYVKRGRQESYPPQHRMDITAEAEKKLREGYEVLYSPEWNTYVLGDRPQTLFDRAVKDFIDNDKGVRSRCW